MAQEQKAKTYDEALALARDYYKANLILNKTDENLVLEDIFPELKESEDERIRKIVINLLKQSTYENCVYEGVKMKDIYAWLEKQGEQKPTNWGKDDEEIHSRICYLIHVAAFENYDVDEVGKELGEYTKITDWLKSIKYRSIWKPSDEQMEALKEACDEHWEPDGLEPLYALYQELKKLRGK